MNIHLEDHQVLLHYGKAMVEIRKFRKFIDGINFSPMDAGKSVVLAYT